MSSLTNQIHIFDGVEELQEAVISFILDTFYSKIERHSNQKTTFNLAISGGSHAQLLYHQKLVNNPNLERWYSSWHIWFVDERVVPQESHLSNYGTTKRLWGEDALICNLATWHDILDYINPNTNEKFGNLPDSMDCILLGMGDDGHYASIFPYNSETTYTHLKSNKELLLVEGAPKEPPKRVTMTPEYILKCSKRKAVLLGGKKDPLMVAKVINGNVSKSKIPARILGEDQAVEWFMLKDSAAALF